MSDQDDRNLLVRALDLLARPRIRNPGLAIAALVLGYLIWQSDDPRSVDTDAIALRGETEPDTFVNQGVFRSFDRSGQPEIVLTSPRTEQFDDRKEALLEAPDGTLYDHDAGLRWLITANSGLYDMAAEIMDLEGDVEVIRRGEGGDAVLLTEYLRIDNASRTATTDRPVTLTSPGQVTHARGLTGWLDDRVLELENSVEGTYETRQ
ncbi:LPS export ABC transporter periplasmic protein LptC [Marinobacter sp.]|uniref:LPS export ABC transporter periplasmic protein LptC n=1 Tax=Marinobacter sp. TaxID=50741 RepID=UPI003566580B